LFVSKGNHDISRFHSEQKMCCVGGGGSGEVLAQEEEESGRRNAQGREPRRRNPNSPFEYFIISNQMKKKPSTIQTLGRQLSQKAYSQRVRLIGKTRRDGWYLSVMKRS
jgi:hypothetical protein